MLGSRHESFWLGSAVRSPLRWLFLGGWLWMPLGCRPVVQPPPRQSQNVAVVESGPSIHWRRLDPAGNSATIQLGSQETLQTPVGGPSFGTPTIEAIGLSPDPVLQLSLTQEACAEILAVYVERETSESDDPTPAMLGTYHADRGTLTFTPRFPWVDGLTYRVEFNPTGASPLIGRFRQPKIDTTPSTVVSQVYPSGEELPENQLKFYLHFSAPMSRGHVYQNVRLLKEDGAVIEYPFLEIAEELWDRSGTRLTLLLDPGRVKRGLKPREEEGPVFEEGKSYTLVIDRNWPDAAGNPLVEDFKKAIRSLPPDDEQPDAKTWKILLPGAESRDALAVELSEPLDHAMLGRVVWVEDSSGEPLEGVVKVDQHETRWVFIPAAAWTPGAYKLAVENTLEDRAGNSLRRKFEVDVFDEVQQQTKAGVIRLPFQIAQP